MIETTEARFHALRRDVPSRPSDAGVLAMGLALTLLIGAEWAFGGRAGAVLAACRGIVLVTLLVLVAEPSVRAGPRVPDVMGIVLATSGLTIDQIAAASRYAPQLNEVGTGPGLHLVSALLTGAAAVVLGARVMGHAEKRSVGVVVACLGVTSLIIAGAGLHAPWDRRWYLALLVVHAMAGFAVVTALLASAPEGRTKGG